LLFHKRDESLARLNVSLTDTLLDILKIDEINQINPKYLILLSIENPLIKSASIDDMVNSMSIFGTDSMISVREESQTFFQHDGHGMKPILNQEKFSKFEREAIYKHAGGMTAIQTAHFLKTKSIISGKVGHIVIDQVSAHSLKTKIDHSIAEFLIKNL
jgi:CMP-N-acetylneuraminic acid synthetase